ncbi:hypothetical protein HAX54_028298, partial [Datura stramonium]|nr:hypothetical protein [Datura stramonium]
VSTANPVVHLNLPQEEMINAQRAKAVRLAEEAQQVDVAWRADAADFVAALVKRNKQNPSLHHGCNTIRNMLFEGSTTNKKLVALEPLFNPFCQLMSNSISQ